MPRIAEQQLSEVGAIAADGTLDVTVITPGWGSSGYYSPQVCEAAAALVKPGTPMYLDHAGATEALDRPGRSVKDIGATFITEGKWDGKRVHAKARLVPGPYRETLLALQETIGTSVSGDATAFTHGEADGRSGRIVEGVASIGSVDFVTRAGRGGSFRSVVESALRESAILEEAGVSDKPWSSFKDSDYTDAQYARACILDRGAAAGSGKDRYSLPVREPSGALNRNGVHAAASRLGSTTASAQAKATAARKLASLYRGPLKEDPPESVLKAAKVSEAADPDDASLLEGLNLTEATASDRMEHLRDAVRSTHGESGARSAWVRDQDAEKKIVWFDVHDHVAGGPASTFQQGYTVGDNDASVSLVGKPKQVRAVTKYVTVGEPGPVKESQEDHMPQIEEHELTRLREAAEQNATLLRERDEARSSDAESRRLLAESDAREEARTAARARAVSGNGSLPEPAVARIVEAATAKVPLNGDGKLDAVSLHATVDRLRESEEAYLRTLVKESGAQIKDFGESADPAAAGGTTTVTEAKRTHTPFGRKIEETA